MQVPSSIKSLFFSCSLLLSVNLLAQSNPPEKVLFIGNSYTYFWNLPQSVAIMAESQNIKMMTRQSTTGGANLGEHWRSERNLKSIPMINEGDFDAIVIQDHSRRAIDAPDSLQHYGALFGDLIAEQNAKVYVYMTWARKWDPYMQDPIVEQYKMLAEQINATIVPVGPAWQRASELRPNLDMYDQDRSHPSTIGTYLSACVFFGVLTGQSPVGLAHYLVTEDKNGEVLFLNIQSKEDALFCQKVAEEIIAEWH